MRNSRRLVACWLLVISILAGSFTLFPASQTVQAGVGDTYRVSVSSGYLALRTAKAYDSRNEIGQLLTGDTVTVQDMSDSTYWYVYSPKYGKYGYVNKDYLIYVSSPAPSSPSGASYTVSVASGYLALRTAMAYDSRNEIGQLLSGDIVYFQSYGDDTYWYVYSPKYSKYGYVNKNYLIGGSSAPSGTSYTVSVASGYLALRTAMAYDDRNEIGQLLSGDVVYFQSYGDDTYWYVYSPKYGKYGYVNKNYLIGSGGSSVPSAPSTPSGASYTVSVTSGYLALRTAMAYDDRNEIGHLLSGDVVYFQSYGDDTYWYVYSPKFGKYGYVNKNYLIGGGSSAPSTSGTPSGTAYTVSVASGYLALRTAMVYDDRNEIGHLLSGDVVYFQSYGDDTYWYVYSPKFGKYGYVNKNYLF